MRFIKLNHGWNAEPNVPDVKIAVDDTDVIVRFRLNPFQFKEFVYGDEGLLTFHNCCQYRVGVPNDEGFYQYGQSRFKQYGIAWGEFYQLEDSGWESEFPDSIQVSGQATENCKHYLFYFRDDTFECIADSFNFPVIHA